MKIEKVNGFWVPSADVHLQDWKQNNNFTQSKCLDKFLTFIEKNPAKSAVWKQEADAKGRGAKELDLTANTFSMLTTYNSCPKKINVFVRIY